MAENKSQISNAERELLLFIGLNALELYQRIQKTLKSTGTDLDKLLERAKELNKVTIDDV